MDNPVRGGVRLEYGQHIKLESCLPIQIVEKVMATTLPNPNVGVFVMKKLGVVWTNNDLFLL